MVNNEARITLGGIILNNDLAKGSRMIKFHCHLSITKKRNHSHSPPEELLASLRAYYFA
jgi:hypothetical protein